MISHRLPAILISLLAIVQSVLGTNPKREFRGAWVTTVYQEQYANQSTEQNKRYLRNLLDKLQDAGVNAILFQARPSADAFYESKYEPWSRYLTKGGKAPQPFWDPLQFMIEECHQRGMELHAWINPYRVTTIKNEKLPAGHLYHKEPGRFVKYSGDGKLYFDPGLPENREFIVKVIEDIVSRYDVDGIHFDDYFYPYPVSGHKFPDDKSFRKYGKGKKLADWRRENVDMLIKNVHDCIRQSSKPWVRFGISPFGIWRNKTSDARGSDTNGLQNYDDLYADVLLWADKGWIDYLIPQLYWELDHKRASSLKLIDWWDNSVPSQCHVYIGQDVERTMKAPDIHPSKEKNQLKHKVELSRAKPNVLGNCWWPAYALSSDQLGAATALKRLAHSTPALVPSYPTLYSGQPDKVTGLKFKSNMLSWKKENAKGKASDAVKYVVYRFDSGKDMDFNDPKNIYAITPDNDVHIKRRGVYAVTAVDRVNNESEPSKCIDVK